MNRRNFVKETLFSAVAFSSVAASGLPVIDLPECSPPVAGKREPLFKVVDLNIDEEYEVNLSDGSVAKVKLINITEKRDSVFNTLDSAEVRLEVNGITADVICGSYRLPVSVAGVQADVQAVSGYMADAGTDWWKLKKAARIRIWPGNSPWITPGTFRYPVRQRWFASRTWFSNEPIPPASPGKVYYHAGMDFGSAEGLTEVTAATDGVILSLGEEVSAANHPAVEPRYDVIYIEDERGWAYRYSHFKSFDPLLTAGGKIKMGQRLGYTGKEGASGGWSHLHFHIESLQPSGEWGVEDSYAFLWQSYLEEHNPSVIAVARPHHKALPGETVELDASRSWARAGIRSYEWLFMDGTGASGPGVKRAYDTPGTYSEIVKVTDNEGNFEYDFTRVAVYPRIQDRTKKSDPLNLPNVHVAYNPTFDIHPGDPVIFLSRCRYDKTGGVDIYNFGDGTPPVEVPSNIDPDPHAANGYGMVVHHFKKPGNYIVRVDRIDEKTGYSGAEHLHIAVE